MHKLDNLCMHQPKFKGFSFCAAVHVWTLSSVMPSGQYKYSPFLMFWWLLAMLFRRWTILSVCQEDLSCKIDVNCLGDEPSCNNTRQLIHMWPLSPHQKYMAIGQSNMQWPILKIGEDDCYVLSLQCYMLSYYAFYTLKITCCILHGHSS